MSRRRTVHGAAATRQLLFKIIGLDGKLMSKTPMRAQKGKYYSEQDIERAIEVACEFAESSWPNLEFRLVELPNFQWNIIAEGEKLVQHSDHKWPSKDQGGVVQGEVTGWQEVDPAQVLCEAQHPYQGRQPAGDVSNDRHSGRVEEVQVPEADVEPPQAPEGTPHDEKQMMYRNAE